MRPLLLAVIVAWACSAVLPSEAWARKKSSKKATTSQRVAAAPKVQRSSSEETRAERERRLLRECRGMPNAGACLGYTR